MYYHRPAFIVDQLENTLTQMTHLQAEDADDAEWRHESMRREMMMAQLITQSKTCIIVKIWHL